MSAYDDPFYEENRVNILSSQVKALTDSMALLHTLLLNVNDRINIISKAVFDKEIGS